VASHITIEPYGKRVRVMHGGVVVADTTSALELKEGGYPPVLYLPRADADMSRFARTANRTTCPYKGEASYYSLTVGGATVDNAVWSYETPRDAVAAISGYLAFDANKVDRIESAQA